MNTFNLITIGVITVLISYSLKQVLTLAMRGLTKKKDKPIELRHGDKIRYSEALSNRIVKADVLIQVKDVVRIRIIERDMYGKQLVVPRNKCSLIVDKNGNALKRN